MIFYLINLFSSHVTPYRLNHLLQLDLLIGKLPIVMLYIFRRILKMKFNLANQLKNMNKNTFNTIMQCILGLLGPTILLGTMPFASVYDKVNYTNTFAAFIFSILSMYFLYYLAKISKPLERLEKILIFTFTVSLSFALIIGKQLETIENWDLKDISLFIKIAFLSCYLYPFMKYLLQKVTKIVVVKEKSNPIANKRFFFITFILLIIGWLPTYLAFFPGAFVYDANAELLQTITQGYNSHHPIVHVLLLGQIIQVIYNLTADYNIGIAVYTFFQMIFCALVLSYSICYVKSKIGMKYSLYALIYLIFFPIVPMFVMNSSKDTIFTMFLLLFLIQAKPLLTKHIPSLKDILLFILCGTLMILFRKNALYAYILFLFIWAISYLIQMKKPIWKDMIKRIMVFILPILLFFFADTILTKTFHVYNGEKQEFLSVPIQQIARAYNEDPNFYYGIELDWLFHYLPEEGLKKYNPRLSDPVKVYFNNDYYNIENNKDFLPLWLKGIKEKPGTFLNAWLMTSYAYWYPDAINNPYQGQTVYSFTYMDSSYFGFETEAPGFRDSKFPLLEEFYRRLSLELYQQQVPGLSMFFSPGFMFWVYLFVFFCFTLKRRFDLMLNYVMIWTLMATLLLGPTVLVRYVLIYWMALPILLTDLFSAEKAVNKCE